MFHLLIIWLTDLLLWGAGFTASPIQLQPQSIPFIPKEFYVATVTDQRSESGPVARLAVTVNQPVQPVDLAGGAARSIQTFINKSLRQNRTLRPMALRIIQLQVTETAQGNRVTGQFTFSVAFDLLTDDGSGNQTSTPLTTYRTGVKYTRPLNETTVIESSIRKAIVTSLRNLNDYMNREVLQNEKLASGLTITFTDDTRLTSDDTVHYNPERLLRWSDFQAQPRQGSHYAAEVFTSFGYEGKSTIENGIIRVNLLVKTYMLKPSSWGRADAKTAYALNHEQRHFDITRIIAERFKQKLPADSLTLDDYNSIIQYQFIESYREMNQMQKQYDRETAHSTNAVAQELWNQKIDAELRKFGIRQ